MSDFFNTESTEQEPDVYVKQEGYGAFKFFSEKAKETAHKLGIPNSLEEFGDEFCEEPVYYFNKPETHKEGLYSCGIKLSHIEKTVNKLRKAGLTVESEFE
jgi:hypothetical protein